MMKAELSNKTAAVVDGGLFFSVALRLAREGGFGRVFYFNDIHQPMPKINEAVVGDGFNEVERVSDVWDVKDQVDCWVFPDCAQPGLQRELKAQGFPVWGSGDGVMLEWDRVKFRQTLEGIGLAVHPYKVIQGVTALEDFLKDKEDYYVRISRYRGNGETWQWINKEVSNYHLLEARIEFGGVAEDIPFLVESAFEASEVGYDGYFAGGRFPSHSFHGIEAKDKSYFGAYVSREDWPDPIKEVNDAIEPVLKRFNYANNFHTEIRCTPEGIYYFTDPTCRHATPAGEPLLEAFANYPEIVWSGAHGVCVDPECDFEFAAQALITHKEDGKRWREMQIPDSVFRWVKLYNPVKLGSELYGFPALDHSNSTVGSVLGMGNTPAEAIENLKKNADKLSGQDVSVETDTLVEAAKVARDSNGEVMELGGAKIPKPAEIIEDA